jgi:pyridoxine 4-dehydrogenase
VRVQDVGRSTANLEIACEQNHYNVLHRGDHSLIADLAGDRIAYVPFFPLGGFTTLQSTALVGVARHIGATPMQVELAWLFRRAPNIRLIPGTSSLAHLREPSGGQAAFTR